MTKKQLLAFMHDHAGRAALVGGNLYLLEQIGSLNSEQKHHLELAKKALKEQNLIIDNFYNEQKESAI